MIMITDYLEMHSDILGSLQETEAKEIRGQFSKLKEDFMYNLSLIEERDRELEGFDVSIAKCKSIIKEKVMSALMPH